MRWTIVMSGVTITSILHRSNDPGPTQDVLRQLPLGVIAIYSCTCNGRPLKLPTSDPHARGPPPYMVLRHGPSSPMVLRRGPPIASPMVPWHDPLSAMVPWHGHPPLFGLPTPHPPPPTPTPPPPPPNGLETNFYNGNR